MEETRKALLNCTRAIEEDNTLLASMRRQKEEELDWEGSSQLLVSGKATHHDQSGREEERYESMCVELDSINEQVKQCEVAVARALDHWKRVEQGWDVGDNDTSSGNNLEAGDVGADGAKGYGAKGICDDSDEETSELATKSRPLRRRLVRMRDCMHSPSAGKQFTDQGIERQASVSSRRRGGSGRVSHAGGRAMKSTLREAVQRLLDGMDESNDKCMAIISNSLRTTAQL